MEVDCFAALGAAHFLVERLKTTSDEFILPVCAKCGMIAEYSRESGYRFCKPCFSGDEVYTVSVSYSSKLFIQELLALHIRAQFILGDNDVDPHAARAGAVRATGDLKPVIADLLKPQAMCDFLNVPKPENWEFESLNIPIPETLLTEIESITAGLMNVSLANTAAIATGPVTPAAKPVAASTATSKKAPRKPRLFNPQ